MLGFLSHETLRERGSTQPTLKRFVRQSVLQQLLCVLILQPLGTHATVYTQVSITSGTLCQRRVLFI
jgi:hypothetical protein